MTTIAVAAIEGLGHAPGTECAPHAFALGRPAAPTFQSVSTRWLPPAQRYDYWTTTVLRQLQASPPSADQRCDFRSHLLSLATPTREMHYSDSDGFGGTRTWRDANNDPHDNLSLLYVIRGQVTSRFHGDEEVVSRAGDFFLYDPTRPQRFEMSHHRVIQVDMSLAEFAFACGGRVPAARTIRNAFASSRLTPLLRSHLEQFPLAAHELSAGEQVTLLDATHAFALLILQGVFTDCPADGCSRRSAQLAAARRYIQSNLDRPDLTPWAVAQAVGCSRATLYRTFEEEGVSVAAYIREQRLQRLHRLLENHHDQRSIALLAQRCGLYDSPNVNQMFRRRFGASPRDVRALARERAARREH